MSLARTSESTKARRQLTPIARLLVSLVLLIGTVIPSLDGVTVAHADSPRLTTFDSEMVGLVNGARDAAGVPDVASAAGLTNLSLWWSNQMASGATGNDLQHNPNAFAMTLQYGASTRTTWGENVAKWSPSTTTASAIFNAYMASPGHKANILGVNFRFVGIGSVTGSNGVSWDTMTFTDKVDAGSVISLTPKGSLDGVTVSDGAIRVTGWTFDPASTGTSIAAHVYINGVGAGAFTANTNRPDVDAAFGITGKHGFDASVPAVVGANNVCAYGISATGNGNALIACKVVTWQPKSSPVGAFDSVVVSGSSIQVSGWSYDPGSSSASIGVAAYVNGVGTAILTAATPRPDVNAAYSISGDHGFAGSFTAPAGSDQVCLYGLSVTGATNSLIGCKTVTVLRPQQPTVGSVDLVSRSGASIRVAGWAFDPSSSSTSILVHVYVNGAGVAVAASGARPDVDAAYSIIGGHGFDSVVSGPASGAAAVCLYAISVTGGANTTLGCRNL